MPTGRRSGPDALDSERPTTRYVPMMHDDGKNCGQQTRDENARSEDRRRDMGGLGDSRENGGRAECKEHNGNNDYGHGRVKEACGAGWADLAWCRSGDCECRDGTARSQDADGQGIGARDVIFVSRTTFDYQFIRSQRRLPGTEDTWPDRFHGALRPRLARARWGISERAR
jgi:hypothetical protein